MKKCCRCKQFKVLMEFRKNVKRADGYQGVCSDCHKQYNKDWYRRNKKDHIKNKTRNRDEKVAWLREYKKQLKCQRCEETYPRCLDFHHRDEEVKIKDISIAVREWSLKRLQTEISKCDVLCANCHRKETFGDD